MNLELLQRLEMAVRQRSPQLAERLQPGLSERRIRRELERSNVGGCVHPIVSLFSWKNGVNNDSGALSREQASLFPRSIYMFMELDMMTAHFQGFFEDMQCHPAYARILGKYFPLFWDGSNSWLAVDLDPSNQSRLILLHTECEQMAFEAYSSFEGFLRDAVRANQEDDSLAGFDRLRPVP
jgi:hypothetical protein